MCEKGFVINNRTNVKWDFQYNPESISFSRSAGYTEQTAPGKAYPLIQYTNGESNEISVTVFVRTEGNISPQTFNDFLDSLMPNKTVDYSTYAFLIPPTCFLYLSPLKHLNFDAVLTGYDFSSDKLMENLLPLYATYNLKFKEVQW